MNAVTPMIIPSSVKNDRSLCAQIADNASLNVSLRFILSVGDTQYYTKWRSKRITRIRVRSSPKIRRYRLSDLCSEYLPERAEVAKQHEGYDDGGKPDVWEIEKRHVRLVESQLLDR